MYEMMTLYHYTKYFCNGSPFFWNYFGLSLMYLESVDLVMVAHSCGMYFRSVNHVLVASKVQSC